MTSDEIYTRLLPNDLNAAEIFMLMYRRASKGRFFEFLHNKRFSLLPNA